jgi:hypothetical protein
LSAVASASGGSSCCRDQQSALSSQAHNGFAYPVGILLNRYILDKKRFLDTILFSGITVVRYGANQNNQRWPQVLALYASMGSAREHEGRPQSLSQVQKSLLEQSAQKQKIRQACIIGGLVYPAPNLSARRSLTTKSWGDGGESNPQTAYTGRINSPLLSPMSKPSPQWGRVNRAPIKRLLFTRPAKIRSGRGDSNSQPTDSKSVALPWVLPFGATPRYWGRTVEAHRKRHSAVRLDH